MAQRDGRAGADTTPWRAAALTLVLLACTLPAWTGLGALEWGAALFARATGPAGLTAVEWWLVWLWIPLAVAGAAVALCAPGLLFVLATGAASTFDHWIGRGFGATVVIVSSTAAIVPALAPATGRGVGFLALLCALIVAAGAFAIVRARSGRASAWPLADPGARGALGLFLCAWFALFVGLTPKILWEAFNGDGAHAFETSRLLLFRTFPFWPPGSGHGVNFPGIGTMAFAYPSSWFIRLFGEVEASARVPFLVFLVALHSALFTLIRHGRARVPSLGERALVWCALLVYAVVMSYSATWDPYSADIALPATQDTLLMVCYAGFLTSFLERRFGWALLLFVLAYMSWPSSVLMTGFWLVSMLWLERPRPWGDVARGFGIMAATIVFAVLFTLLLSAMHLPPPGSEHALAGLLRRFAFLQYAYVGRIAWLVVPGGIVPALAMCAWPWLDRVSRSLVVICVAYFALFYIQAYVMLHHLVPTMLLPIVVLWRLEAPAAPAWCLKIRPVATLAGVVAAMWLSLPPTLAPVTASREIGRWVEDRTAGYDRMSIGTFRRADLLADVFPFDWQPSVPDDTYGGSPYAWLYYGHHTRGEPGRDFNYVLVEGFAPNPGGMRLQATNEAGALYVRSDEVWQTHRAFRPATPAGSWIYQTPRGMLFHSVPLKHGPPIFEVKPWLESFGIDLNPILDRFGIVH